VIRVYSMEAGAVVKGQGKPNDLLDRIRGDARFAVIHDKLDAMYVLLALPLFLLRKSNDSQEWYVFVFIFCRIDPSKFVGRAPEQVEEFLSDEVDPVLDAHKDLLTVENVDGINV